MWRWCRIEYKHISNIVGKENCWFTNIKKGCKGLERWGKVIRQPVSKLNLKRVCVLDPEAEKAFAPEEAEEFDYVVFGGILGNHPPEKRTKKELTNFLPAAQSRNIGQKQMSTDNAVYVVNEIIRGKHLSEIAFKDEITIQLTKSESTSFPYRYAVVNGKPLVSEELIDYLKRKRGL